MYSALWCFAMQQYVTKKHFGTSLHSTMWRVSRRKCFVNLNLPGTPNTSSEYYMECAACANDGFEIRNKIKNNFYSQVFRILLFSGF